MMAKASSQSPESLVTIAPTVVDESSATASILLDPLFDGQHEDKQSP